VFSSAVRARFDLVSWDPRGIQYSDPLNCFASATASQGYFNSDPVFPYPQTQEPAFFTLNAQLGKDCEQRAPVLVRHISTTDTARDLDLLRRDVGDKKLGYLGFSYGTVLGATYANLFPGNVRAMVLDGSLDFQGNVTGDHPGDSSRYPIDVRQGVDKGGQDIFGRFLTLCAIAKSKCAFSAGGNLPAKWAALLSRAQAGQLSYQNLMIYAYYDMEKPIADWPGLASYLQGLYTATSAGQVLSARREAGLASVYHNLASSEDAKVPGFGRLIVYDTMPCATWPAMHTDAYNGPWNRSRTTILVINALHDPFTPIAGARAGARELVKARLLTVNGDGHTSMYVEPSTCRDHAELTYLVSGKLPARGAVCPVNALPFGLTP
jgi:pimeloyl-ACP methyl ester carboxylesterase